MTFLDVPGYRFTDPIEWHGNVEVIHGLSTTGVNIPTTSDLVAGPTNDTPVEYWQTTSGHAHFIRSFGGPFPQETAGLQCAWTHARLGHDTASTMLQWGAGVCQTPVAGLGGGSNHGAGYAGESDVQSFIFPSGVTADCWVGGYYLNPSLIYSAWTNQFFDYPGGDSDPVLIDEFNAALDASDPGVEGALVQSESFGPIFVGYQLAPDEIIGGGNSGTVFWGRDASGWGLTMPAPGDDPSDMAWAGPGAVSAEMLADYSGGVHDWVTPPDEWVPGWDEDNQEFIPADVPLIPLTVYHDFHTRARLISPGIYEIILNELVPPAGASEMPDGYSVSLGSVRENQGLALKAIWRPPTFRWAIPAGVTRQWSRSPDGYGLSGGVRLFPPPKSGRIFGGEQ